MGDSKGVVFSLDFRGHIDVLHFNIIVSSSYVPRLPQPKNHCRVYQL
jgi:hypothetical protein